MALTVKRSYKAELLRSILLDLQELHGVVEGKAAELTRHFDETPARYKVLTAAGCDTFTVPQVARRMGLTRQAVQKIVNQLVQDGLAELAPNPDHKTSPIVQLTRRGASIDDAISSRLAARNNQDARKLNRRALETTADTLRELCRVLAED